MNLLDIITGPIFHIIDKLVPDQAQKAQMQLQVLQLNQAGEFKELDAQLQRDLAQIGVDNTEAASPSLFKSGWRPFIGWLCGLGLGYQFLLQPMLAWVSTWKHIPAPPTLDLGTLVTILGGLLGLGAMRTTERIQGVIPRGK